LLVAARRRHSSANSRNSGSLGILVRALFREEHSGRRVGSSPTPTRAGCEAESGESFERSLERRGRIVHPSTAELPRIRFPLKLKPPPLPGVFLMCWPAGDGPDSKLLDRSRPTNGRRSQKGRSSQKTPAFCSRCSTTNPQHRLFGHGATPRRARIGVVFVSYNLRLVDIQDRL
jgi:hypothetical protein